MILKKIRKILNKELKIKNHIPYEMYGNAPLLKDIKNKWLKKEFKEYNLKKDFITALYNLTKYLPSDTTLGELKKHLDFLKNSEYYPLNTHACREGVGYYAKIIKGVSPYTECILSIYKVENCDFKKNEYIPITLLGEYLANNPNRHCWPGFSETDKKTNKELIKKGLMNKPSRKEKKIFN